MNVALILVLSFLIGSEDRAVIAYSESASSSSSRGISGSGNINDDTARYCRICASHTMCLFPYDDPGPKCGEVENSDLEPEEIEWILERHNSLRDGIARAWKSQYWASSAWDMMQVFWDNELSYIARRWALQCNVDDEDECRDVERFPVSQNVSVLVLQGVGDTRETTKLEWHLKNWYNPLQTDFRRRGEFGWRSPVGLATPSVTNVGCGRATYNATTNDGPVAVEVLVCNYGPIDDAEPERGFAPPRCETRSRSYSELCSSGIDSIFQNFKKCLYMNQEIFIKNS